MSGPSLSKLADLFKKPASNVVKPPAPNADKWLENFCIWLEESYQKLVHHERDPRLHASTLYQTCARKELLIELLKPPPEHLVAGQLMTFDVGHMMHWWWQHRYLGPKQELWGDWYCAGCALTTHGFMPLACPCGRDWRSAINYKELLVEDKTLGYVGHTDGVLVDRVSGKRRIFEFKSASPTDYKEITKPKKAHIIQAHAYMRVLGPDEALIVYQNKGSQCEWRKNGEEWIPGKPNIKPFIVKFDNNLWSKVEKQIHDRADALTELNAILKDGKLTEAQVCKWGRICESRNDEPAKYCPVAGPCFNMRAPNDSNKPIDPKAEFRIPL